MPIQILSDDVASQIAAGEVVERPASVVKELLENSLDAHARRVVVRVELAGRRLIEVADDGCGIPADEVGLALARHATSKLRNAEDLFHIRTLGFRGEALASIGSVSRLTIVSRTEDAETGARLVVEGGQARVLERIGAPVGTVVRVEDLFYNVPARLKFLKQDATERQQIDGLLSRYALAYADVALQLFQDGRPVLQTSGNGNRREVLAQLFGVETARQMLEVTLEDEGLRVTGYISPVALTRSNRREITFFVNGRWVQDIALTQALLQAYHTLLMVGRYPLAVLFVELEPEMVDVNVHPAKAEVRFRTPDRVFGGVSRAARRALLAYSPVPTVASGGGSWHPDPLPRMPDPAWEMAAEAQEEQKPAAPIQQGVVNVAVQDELPSGNLPLLRLIGQVGGTYLIAEGPDGLYLIDQHAAHERVLFERLMQQYERHQVASQVLLEPLLLQLPPAQARLLQDQLDALLALGFEVELFGANTFRVRSLPALLMGADPAAAVRAVVEDFEEDEVPLQREVERRIAARVCKRSAVKAGQLLSMEEQRALLLELERCVSPRTCPHGRPTMIHLSVDLLERQFGRKGSR
jgi:DNA mismatch repair protein MutL